MMKRNYGIDLLRMLSMFMVLILHMLGQGGMLQSAEPLSLKYWLLWFLELTCYCAVNIFALISGYVMYRSNAKLSKVLSLWLQVVFYTIGALVAFWILKPESVGLKMIADAVFPVSRGHYWYISSYFGLLVLQPLLNIAIEHAEKKVLGTVLLTAFVMLCTIPTFLKSDPYLLFGGYTTIWLVLLYLAGAYIHKYQVGEKITKGIAWVVCGVTLLIAFGFMMGTELFPQNILPVATFRNVLLSYNAPTAIVMAVSLLIALSKQSFGKISTKVIAWSAPAVLSVYLIHTNQLVWEYIIKNCFSGFVEYHWTIMILLIFAVAVAIFVVCILIEKVRIYLFKLVKIDLLCVKVEHWMEKILHRFTRV